MSLTLTRERRRLLAAVARGDVHLYGDRRTYSMDSRELTARIAQAQRQGWVVLGETHPVKTPWLLTDEGRKALATDVPLVRRNG